MNQEPARSDEQLDVIIIGFLTPVVRRPIALGYVQPVWRDPRTHCVDCADEIPPGRSGRKCQSCRKRDGEK